MKETIGWKKIRERHEHKIIDGIQYDTDKFFTYLVNAFHLGDLAKNETVEMVITVDGAKLDDKVHHVTIGIKICDKCAYDPVTGELIFDENLPDGEEGNMQSAERCFPVMAILAKYNKGTYDKYFRDIFAFCDKVHTTSINRWKPFRIYDPQEMKSTQIVLGRGGAAKVKENCCHLCYFTSTNLALQSQLPCQYCYDAGITVYLHHPVCDGDCITKAQLELGTLELNSDSWKLIEACKNVKLLPLPQPPVRARTDVRTNPSAQRATQLRSVLGRVNAVSIQNQITTTVP
jgi:hypothetical protein